MLLFLALILWPEITFLRFKNVKFISDSVKTWQLSLIFSRNVDGCGNVLNNKQDFSFWDLVATDGYSKAQMVTGLKPTRYPLFSTWQSGNSWLRNDLFTEQLSLDNWMCVWERETEKKGGREKEHVCGCMSEHACESVCTLGCECTYVWVHVNMYVCVCQCVCSLYMSLHALQRTKRLFWESYSSHIAVE